MSKFAASLALCAGMLAIAGPSASANTVTPTSHNFGSVSVGASARADFTYTASTNSTANPNFLGSATGFTIVNSGIVSKCDGQPLMPGQSCNFAVSFSPPAGGSYATTVRVSGSTGPMVTLAGTGLAAPVTPTPAPAGKKGKKCKKPSKKSAFAAKKKCGKKKK